MGLVHVIAIISERVRETLVDFLGLYGGKILFLMDSFLFILFRLQPLYGLLILLPGKSYLPLHMEKNPSLL